MVPDVHVIPSCNQYRELSYTTQITGHRNASNLFQRLGKNIPTFERAHNCLCHRCGEPKSRDAGALVALGTPAESVTASERGAFACSATGLPGTPHLFCCPVCLWRVDCVRAGAGIIAWCPHVLPMRAFLSLSPFVLRNAHIPRCFPSFSGITSTHEHSAWPHPSRDVADLPSNRLPAKAKGNGLHRHHYLAVLVYHFDEGTDGTAIRFRARSLRFENSNADGQFVAGAHGYFPA
jgi:hypothetical protein